MTKEDYREKVEEHRQEIELEESIAKRSRSSRHSNAKKVKQKNPIMKLLVFVFILIPLCILGYVWIFFEPESPVVDVAAEADDKGIVLEIQNQDDKNTNSPAPVENDKDSSEAPKEPVEDELAKETAAAEEARKEEEAQKVAAKQFEEQKAQSTAQSKAAEEKKKQQEAAKANAKSHTVSSSDNLYRIALKYYNNGSAEYVNKIKQANGLSSDSISAGQVLIIP